MKPLGNYPSCLNVTSFCPVPPSPSNLACFLVDRWNTYVVDGRDVEALCEVFWQATQVKNKPTAVIAKTFKGRGIPSKQVSLFSLGLLKTSVCTKDKAGDRLARQQLT